MKTKKLHLVYEPTRSALNGRAPYKVVKTINMVEPKPGEHLTEGQVRSWNQKKEVVVTITEGQ